MDGSRRRPAFATYNPATGDIIAEVAESGDADVDMAVSAARRAIESGPGRGWMPPIAAS
jgi:acyl-CoA reductase-like NAD-dependent aldehyde dehydrogenase